MAKFNQIRSTNESTRDLKGMASPVALIPKTGTLPELELLKGQVIEVRYSMKDGEEGATYMHCWEGTVTDAKIAGQFVLAGVTVSTKLPLVLVEWDEVFRSEPCWVPLDPKLYANEKKAHGWNMLKSEYVRWKEREAQAQREKEAEGQEQRRRR